MKLKRNVLKIRRWVFKNRRHFNLFLEVFAIQSAHLNSIACQLNRPLCGGRCKQKFEKKPLTRLRKIKQNFLTVWLKETSSLRYFSNWSKSSSPFKGRDGMPSGRMMAVSCGAIWAMIFWKLSDSTSTFWWSSSTDIHRALTSTVQTEKQTWRFWTKRNASCMVDAHRS